MPVEVEKRVGEGVPAAGARRSGGRIGAQALLFEVSWEACNQIGGIYQVLRSKAPTMVERWRHQYCLVGPYVPHFADIEFEPLRSAGWLGRTVEALAKEGLRAHQGRWLIPGRPRLVLLECDTGATNVARVRAEVAGELGIHCRADDPLLDTTLAFGDAVRRFLEEAWRQWAGDGTGETPDGDRRRSRRVLVHFHEWLGSLALPWLRHREAQHRTIFTTHATQVGRYAAPNEEDFYHLLGSLKANERAAEYGIAAQHEIEHACARDCDVLTTVSPITAEECTHLLERCPDVVTPNGLDHDRFDLGADFQTIHGQHKEAIHEFTMAHFFPTYSFDLDRTLYFFTSGRFEPHNKGFDLCLETMARLNAELRAAELGITVVFFVVTDRSTRSIHPDALHARGVLNELREVSERLTAEVAERLFRRGAAGDRMRLDELVDEYWRLRFRRTQQALHVDQPPLLTTHVLENEADDPVLRHIRQLGIQNGPDDPVKVVYHPRFITSVNPLWAIEYEQFVRGCHLGIFPSMYEPWGYTPLECIAMGVPAITSDLAGFGRYVAEAYPDHDEWGLNVLARRGRDFHDAAADLTQRLLAFCRLDRRGRIALRNRTVAHAYEFDWSNLGAAYHQAHDRALAERPGWLADSV